MSKDKAMSVLRNSGLIETLSGKAEHCTIEKFVMRYKSG